MSIHLKHISFFLILMLQLCKNFTISHASDPSSRPVRFFEFDLAPSPNRTPFTPSPAPSPPLQPPIIDPHPPHSPPRSVPSPALPETPPLPLPPSQSSPFSAASGGMKGGPKAGIVVGSLAGVTLLVAAGIMYNKRRSDATRMQLEMAAMQPVFQVASDGNASSYSRLDEHAR